MSKSQSKIPSPARSQGFITPRRPRTRRTRSAASPARSDVSGRLSSVLEKFVKDDFVLSPLKRRSVLPDDTEIEAPRRASWWRRLEGSSRDVLEALDTNKMTDDLPIEEYEFEVETDKQNQSAPESSSNESVASIVVPQRKLFNQKKQPEGKFADIMGSRKSLGKTNIEDQSIEDAPKNLFNKGPRNKPVFPAALLNSTNKTINKTVEPEAIKQSRPTLFGQAGTKRKNMFTDFVVSDSEEDSEVEHKVFGFKKNSSKRISLGTRNRRMPSLTPSITTEIDIDDWNLLPSSTMIGAQEVSRISTDEVEHVQEENQDVTLTEENESVNRDANNRSNEKSIIENDKTLTNENIRAENQEIKMNESSKTNKTHAQSKTELNESVKDKTLQNKSSTRANAENEEVIELVMEKLKNNGGVKNQITEVNEQSLEDKIAELHGESVEKEKSRQQIQLDGTKENLENYKDTENHTDGKDKQEIEPTEEQKVQEASKPANNANQTEDDVLPEKDKRVELGQSIETQKGQNRSKEASIINQDEHVNDKVEDKCNKDKSGIEPIVEDQGSEEHVKEASNTNQKEDMENESEEEIEPSAEQQDTQDHSEEASGTNQDEDMNDISEKDKSEEGIEPSNHDEEDEHESNEEIEPSAEQQDTQDHSEEASGTSQDEDEVMNNISEQDKSGEEIEPSDHDEESHENEDEEMKDISGKDKSEEIEPSANHQEGQNGSKDETRDNQDEDMDKMVWNDNDDEKASDDSEAGIYAKTKQNDEEGNESRKNDRTVDRREITNKSKNFTNKSQKIVESSVDNDQIEEVVDETPNNSTHDTTGRNRKKENIKSPEAALKNMTIDNESFRPIGRSTTFRKSKSVYEMMNRSLAPVQESTLGSEGSKNSSTEGSEWDSHRTTRKTIRQTLGKEYTTRKSLRALIMEQSAKRQTEVYNKNTSNINKTKNKSALEGNNKNISKMNKTKNETLIEDANNTEILENNKNKTVSGDKNASTINKTKTILEDVNNRNAAIYNNKNKTVLEDVNDQHIRRRTSNRNLASNQSPISKSPVHGTSTHHVPDTLIPKHQMSYLKSLHEIKDPEILDQIFNREDSIHIPEYNDSGPEISMNASYGQGMSADTAHEASAEENEALVVEMNNTASKEIKETQRRHSAVRSRSIRNSDPEVLDYEASELEKTEQEILEIEVDEENLEQDDSMQQSVQEEKENSEQEESENEVEEQSDHEESEQDNEDSQQEIEAESEQEESQQEIAESEHEESQQEIESDQEESQQEIETEHEVSQQEIAESEHEESQQEIDSEQEESQQEIESESEHENQQENESEEESENEQDNDSQPETDQESDQENREPERDSEDELVSGLNSQYHDNRTGVSRVVFDSQMMSVDEIDFEGVSRQTDNDNEGSRQTDNDNTKQSLKEPELSRNTRVSEPSAHDVSVGTRKALLLMQMQKVAQQNMEIRQKIRDKMDKLLKPRNCNMSPVPKYSIRRITKEPKQPKKPKPSVVAMEKLPKAFVEDLLYKPPKRFQPANAPWITKRLYKFLETKLEPKYDYRARVRAEELVQTIHSFSKLVRRRNMAPPEAIDQLKREMARLRIVNTHFEFYEFFHEFMPREVRLKVNPSVANKIPMPRNGVFGEILPSGGE